MNRRRKNDSNGFSSRRDGGIFDNYNNRVERDDRHNDHHNDRRNDRRDDRRNDRRNDRRDDRHDSDHSWIMSCPGVPRFISSLDRRGGEFRKEELQSLVDDVIAWAEDNASSARNLVKKISKDSVFTSEVKSIKKDEIESYSENLWKDLTGKDVEDFVFSVSSSDDEARKTLLVLSVLREDQVLSILTLTTSIFNKLKKGETGNGMGRR